VLLGVCFIHALRLPKDPEEANSVGSYDVCGREDEVVLDPARELDIEVIRLELKENPYKLYF
jgi:hypothetical protein